MYLGDAWRGERISLLRRIVSASAGLVGGLLYRWAGGGWCCWVGLGLLVGPVLGVRFGCWFTGISYGFAYGLMTSLVAQFGSTPSVALAADGLRGHDRALVRVTAHAFGRAAVCRVWWVPKIKGRPPAGTTAWGEAAVGLVGCGP